MDQSIIGGVRFQMHSSERQGVDEAATLSSGGVPSEAGATRQRGVPPVKEEIQFFSHTATQCNGRRKFFLGDHGQFLTTSPKATWRPRNLHIAYGVPWRYSTETQYLGAHENP